MAGKIEIGKNLPMVLVEVAPFKEIICLDIKNKAWFGSDLVAIW